MRTIKLQNPSFPHLSFTKPLHAVGLSVRSVDPCRIKCVIPSVSLPLEISLLIAVVCSMSGAAGTPSLLVLVTLWQSVTAGSCTMMREKGKGGE